MNKKQLLIAWIVVILIVIVCLNPATYFVGLSPRTDIARTLFYIFVIIAPGGLLFYIARSLSENYLLQKANPSKLEPNSRANRFFGKQKQILLKNTPVLTKYSVGCPF